MEDRNGLVTNYRSSSATASSPPNYYYNYQSIPYHHQSQPNPVQRYTFCSILAFVTLILSFTILAITFFIISILFMPHGPEFQVDSLTFSNLTSTNESRVFISEIQLTAWNPSIKQTLDYDRIVTSIYYKYVLLSQTDLLPFSLKPKSETSLVAKFAVEWNFLEKWVVDEINEEIEENGNVEFNFRFVSSVNWDCKSWSCWNGRDVLKVSCRDLVVGIPSNGSPGALTSGPIYCQIEKEKLLSWFN